MLSGTLVSKQRFPVIPAIHVLLNNAGLMKAKRTVTVDGFETTFAVNHLAHFLLTHRLLDRLKASGPARIVNVSSAAHYRCRLDFDDLQHEKEYARGGFDVYKRSKLANVLYTYELARRLEGTNVTANALHPGFVSTGFNKNNGVLITLAMLVMRPAQISAEAGAKTSIYLSLSDEVDGVTGKYFDENQQQARSSRASYDVDVQRRLWDVSVELTQAH